MATRRGRFRSPPRRRDPRSPGFLGPSWRPGQGALEGTYKGGIELGLEPPGRADLSRSRRSESPLGPPPGTYDPQLDASLRASQRGLEDFLFDTRRAGQRSLADYRIGRQEAAIGRTRGRRDLSNAVADAAQDYRVGKADIGSEYGRSLADLLLNRDRSLADIGQTRSRSQEDYGEAVAGLQRRYGILGSQQNQAARAAGLSASSYAAQAAAKRAANQAVERKPLDTSLARTLQDLDLSEGRLKEDVGTAQTRLGENRDRAMLGLDTAAGRSGRDLAAQTRRLEQDYTRLLGSPGKPNEGRLYTDYYRGVEDRAESERRARREASKFGQDIAGSQYYQARYGAGTLPVWSPSQGGPRRRDTYTPPRRRRR